MGTGTESVAEDMLKSFVRRVEAIEDELKALNTDKSEIYKEAKSAGFDVKVLRRVIADRRKDSGERAQFETVYDLYWTAIHGVVRAHVENIEEFDAETGEILGQSQVGEGVAHGPLADVSTSLAGAEGDVDRRLIRQETGGPERPAEAA